jgi:uncharacterized membrane protein YbaN (DUF454 family)
MMNRLNYKEIKVTKLPKFKNENTGKILRITGGSILLTIGVLGLILPILPGWLLIIPGLFLLGENTKVSRFIISKMPHAIRQKMLSQKKPAE